MHITIGIDPGTTQTAFCVVGLQKEIIAANKIDNERLISYLEELFTEKENLIPYQVAIEGMQCYGKKVGKEVFETCYMIGRIQQVCKSNDVKCAIYTKPEYTKALCGVAASDALLWKTLKIIFNKNDLALLVGETDKRSAFAVAVYHNDKIGRQ